MERNITNTGSLRIDENGNIHGKRGTVARVSRDDIDKAVVALRGMRFPCRAHDARFVFRDTVRARLIAANIAMIF